jgi:hypothetical protein
MLRKLTKSVCLVLALTAAQHAGAFTLWGPLEAWQTADLDYGVRFYYQNVDVSTRLGFQENGGPKNFGEGSRLTTSTLTYGFDNTFLEYFGVDGEKAVEAAMSILNALPSASSANLSKFLTDGNQQFNYTAQALQLLDLKSTVLWLMAEHMGLLGETHVWDLRAREHFSTPTCDYYYYVVNRSYDPVTYDPTPYVNGRLYGYIIWDGCPIAINVGDAIETPADTTAPRFTAVATGEGLELGGFYLGMTRDDVGGLKNLYKKNNYAFQSLDAESVATPFTSSWMPVGTNGIAGISNFDGLLGGVEKITFVKVNFDSQLNPGFTPLTYKYTIPWVTNSSLTEIHVTRTVTTPDILFTAADLVNPAAIPPAGGVTPSTINPQMVVVLNNVGAIYWNINPEFMDSQDFYTYPIFIWGSFDGSTNAPIVYPQGTSLAELEAQVFQPGSTMPLNPWAPVTLNTNTVPTGGGGGVTGAGPGAASLGGAQ